jgi:hypothetical protein
MWKPVKQMYWDPEHWPDDCLQLNGHGKLKLPSHWKTQHCWNFLEVANERWDTVVEQVNILHYPHSEWVLLAEDNTYDIIWHKFFNQF